MLKTPSWHWISSKACVDWAVWRGQRRDSPSPFAYQLLIWNSAVALCPALSHSEAFNFSSLLKRLFKWQSVRWSYQTPVGKWGPGKLNAWLPQLRNRPSGNRLLHCSYSPSGDDIKYLDTFFFIVTLLYILSSLTSCYPQWLSMCLSIEISQNIALLQC